MIPKTISHYKILEKLGEGGMGVVYKAEDTRLDRIVALKFLPPRLTTSETDKARFLQEAKAASAIDHPNVCVIHDIQEHEDRQFIIMQYVEGKTLRDIVGAVREPPQQIRDVIHYAIQIAEALKAAHAKDIIHRDVKSDNIMITPANQVKVMDFGLARLKGSVKLTKTASTVGTLAYMSPEHIQGKEVDCRTDIFSFGVVLYEMLTGRLPFKGEYDTAMIYAIVNEEPEPIQDHRPDVSPELIHVLNRALEKNPEDRYQTVNEMLIDLRRLKRDTDRVPRESMEHIPPTGKVKTANVFMKRPWITYASVTVLLLILAGLFGRKLFRTIPPAESFRERSIAVMYFEDHSGEENFGRILAEMLTSNLSRCEQIDVISSQHLFDILKKMKIEDIEAIDRSIATEIAVNARVKTMLLGSIDRIGRTFNVNAQLCDVRTGSVIGPAQARGTNVEDIYPIVNRLTEDVIRLMGVPAADDREPLRINDVTTHSFEAYKHYQKGIEHCRRFAFRDGVREFREAIRLDSTFAMAYSRVALYTGVFRITNPLGDLSKEREYMRLAKKYSQKTTEMERGLIRMVDAIINRDLDSFLERAKELSENYPDEKETHYFLGHAQSYSGNKEQAAGSFKRALEIDPEFASSYNILAYIYSGMNEHEKAISAVKSYIALQPDVWNVYDTAFDIYLKAGRYEDAYRICEEALRVNPEWIDFLQNESYIHLFRGEGEMARRKNRDLAKMYPSNELTYLRDLGCFDMYEGRYREAAAEFQKAVDRARHKEDGEGEIRARLSLGKFHSVQEDFSKAYREFSEIKSLSAKIYGQSYNTWPVLADYYSGVTAIRQGDFEKAMESAGSIRVYIEENQYDNVLMDFYYLLSAAIHVQKGQPADAFSRINEISPISRGLRYRKLMADLLVSQGRTEDAIREYKKLYSGRISSIRFDYFYERSLGHYRIAGLYEKIGDRQQAVLYYEKALAQWKNADEDLPELLETKARLAGLKNR
jgi:serine/threonine protein kinase/tetratricopeptide (TPR) repeat protein